MMFVLLFLPFFYFVFFIFFWITLIKIWALNMTIRFILIITWWNSQPCINHSPTYFVVWYFIITHFIIVL